MLDPIEVVSRRTGRKLTVPRKRYDRHPDLFKLPPRKRGKQQREAVKDVEPTTPASPATEADITEKEAADGAQT